MSRYERENIRRMDGYTWGEQPDDNRTIKLNTNENPYPPSPAVDAALQGLSAASLRTYPQPTSDPLRDKLAQHHAVERDNIVVTNGGDEALRLALTTFAAPGMAIGTLEPSYSLYPVLAAIADTPVFSLPYQDNWTIPADYAQQANEHSVRLTCLVNPQAPSGVLTPVDELRRLADSLEGLLLLDEAYIDFIDPALNHDATPLIHEHDNVLILRTFSKGYSLAGLRLGYLIGCDDLIDPIVTKTRDSYNIDHVSQTLGLAAFMDQNYATGTWQSVREARESLKLNLGQLGFEIPPSETNFLLARVPEGNESAKSIYEQLKAAGILVRFFDKPGLNDKLRITIGTPEQNQQLVEELSRILKL